MYYLGKRGDWTDFFTGSRYDKRSELPTAVYSCNTLYRHPYTLPALDDFTRYHTRWATRDVSDELACLGSALVGSGVSDYECVGVTQGATITRYRFSFGDFRDVKKAVKLAPDFSAAVNRNGVTVQQDGAYVVVDVPYRLSELRLGDVLRDPKYKSDNRFTVAIGKSVDGEYVFDNLENMKHVLIAGASGSGKSVFVQGLIMSLLAKHAPDELEMYMIDPKKVEFSFYRPLPYCHVMTETRDAVHLLRWLTEEMDRRYDFLARVGARDITSYVNGGGKMKRLVVVIDELADLMEQSKSSVESSIVRIAQKARACGIHLVIATQYPVAKVVTGLIKQNLPTKICFSVSNSTASCVALGQGGAEKLLGNGDMLYQTEKDLRPRRLQSGLVEDKEIRALVGCLYKNVL